MASIKELNFSKLKGFYFVHVLNRSKYILKHPGLLAVLIACTFAAHIVYFRVNFDTQTVEFVWTQIFIRSALNFAVNFVLAMFLYFLVSSLIAAFYGSFNHTFTKKFIAQNKLKTLASSRVSVSVSKNSFLPLSASLAGKFRVLPEYSFSILTEKGSPVEITQFTTRVPVGPNSDFYFLSAKIAIPKLKAPQIYLDSYKNGRSIMRLFVSESLQLEGEFYKKYRLYHKEGEETEVRVVLTPDVMETLLELKTPYDIEMSGDYVWIIAKGFHMTEPDLKLICKTVDRVVSELAG